MGENTNDYQNYANKDKGLLPKITNKFLAVNDCETTALTTLKKHFFDKPQEFGYKAIEKKDFFAVLKGKNKPEWLFYKEEDNTLFLMDYIKQGEKFFDSLDIEYIYVFYKKESPLIMGVEGFDKDLPLGFIVAPRLNPTRE